MRYKYIIRNIFSCKLSIVKKRNFTLNTFMKYLLFSLFLGGHLTLCGYPCSVGTEESNNIVLEQKDSVLRERINSNRFEKISIVHTKQESLTDLKQTEIWETKEYAMRQKSIFEQMEYKVIEQIPIPILKKALKYKYSPIICKLIIAPHDGFVKKASFQMRYKISSYFTNEDILNIENIILNTKFTPELLTSGDIVVYNWPIRCQSIKKYLDSNK